MQFRFCGIEHGDGHFEVGGRGNEAANGAVWLPGFGGDSRFSADLDAAASGIAHLRASHGETRLIRGNDKRTLRNDLEYELRSGDIVMLGSQRIDLGPTPPDGVSLPRSIENKYLPVRVVGRGARGVVFEVTSHGKNSSSALKVQSSMESAGDEEAITHLACSQIPGVAAILEQGSSTDSSLTFIEMELGGKDLEELVDGAGRADAHDLARLAQFLGRTVSNIHDAGVYHGDIKPANIVCAADHGFRIVDFGSATMMHSLNKRRRSDFSPEYAAPEVILGAEPSVAADAFAVAATLYFAATGQSPRRGADERILSAAQVAERARAGFVRELDRPDIPAALSRKILAGLSVDPAARPAPVRTFSD